MKVKHLIEELLKAPRNAEVLVAARYGDRLVVEPLSSAAKPDTENVVRLVGREADRLLWAAKKLAVSAAKRAARAER